MDIPDHYFSLHFMCLRILAVGYFPSLKKKSYKEMELTSNFPLKYILTTVLPVGFTIIIAVPVLELLSFHFTELDNESVVTLLLFGPLHMVMLIKVGLYYLKSKQIIKIAYVLEVSTKQFYQNYDLIRQTIRLTRFILIFFFGLVLMTTGFGCSNSFRNIVSEVEELNEDSGKEEIERKFHDRIKLPYVMVMPFSTSNAAGFIVAYIFQVTAIALWGFVIGSADLFIFTCMIHLATQFKILQEYIETIVHRAAKNVLQQTSEDNTSKLEQFDPLDDTRYIDELIDKRILFKQQLEKELNLCLTRCIRHHQLIIDTVKDLQRFYTVGYFSQFVSSVYSICIAMSALNTFEPLSFPIIMAAVYFCGMLTQLGTLCWAGSEITHQSSVVATSIESVQWFYGDRDFRSNLIFMLMRAQRTVKFTAANFITLSLASFLATLRAAYSYYTVLNQTA